jgi:hypothetical protein
MVNRLTRRRDLEISRVIEFGEWLPDQPALNNTGATEAKNVIPALKGYRCFRQLSALSGAATNKILGMYAGKDDSGNTALYAGDSGKLYKFNATNSALDDVSKAGGYTTASGNKWRFAQFGETLIATNFSDPVQTITVAAGGLFADLGGTPPKGKYITVVRDQVMIANVNDGVDGLKPYRIWWSGINDATSWTSGTALSDYQDVVDVGDCTGIIGGEYAIVLFEKAIVRATFVGSPLIYQFDKLTNDRGCTVPGSVASVGPSLVFFLSEDGFYMMRGNEIVPIGAQRVNAWFLDRFKSANRDNVVSAVDPINQNVIWAYPSLNSGNGENDEIIVYNYHLNRWSYAEQATTAIAQLFTAGYTLEQLDNISSSIDSLPASLDDGIYQGGTFFFAGAKDKKVQSFTGDCLDATIETGEFSVSAGRHSMVNNVLPYVSVKAGQSPTVSASIGSRSRQIDTTTFTSASSINSDGYCPVRSSGAFHRVRLSLTGDYDVAQGVDVDAQNMGLR